MAGSSASYVHRPRGDDCGRGSRAQHSTAAKSGSGTSNISYDRLPGYIYPCPRSNTYNTNTIPSLHERR